MIRVAIIADIRLYQEGLAQILGRHPNIKVVATAGGTNGSLSSVAELAPDLVLIDMAMPDRVGAIRRVVAAAPEARVVTLGVAENAKDVVASAEAGASAYVPREGSLEDLIAVIEAVARGEAVCSPRIAGALLRRVATLASERGFNQIEGHLTNREREIVWLVDEGLSNKEIAKRLCIEVATVKNHVHNIPEKLQVHRRGEAAARVRAASPRRSSEPAAIR